MSKTNVRTKSGLFPEFTSDLENFKIFEFINSCNYCFINDKTLYF